MIVSRLGHLEDEPGLSEEVGAHVGADDVVVLVEFDLQVLACYVMIGHKLRIQFHTSRLAESGRIVVSRGLGVADGLHDGRRRQHLLLHLRLGLQASKVNVRDHIHSTLQGSWLCTGY